ncbi:MAG: BCD family MFS transporter [Rubrivivax sp.]|nr:BCD family MFS transporter [Rubrivivax sp.]
MTSMAQPQGTLGWGGVVRLGLVQASIGAIVVLATSTLNRVMVVELALPALLPGVLVALHYVVQLLRPRMGFGSDVGGRRTPWIVGGMGVLALGGVGAAAATAWMASAPAAGIALAVVSFAAIGIGVSASGTSLLALLARAVPAERRAPAATLVWIMMIAGFAVTATVVGRMLDPYSHLRLVQVTAIVALAAFILAALAVRGVERRAGLLPASSAAATVEAAPRPRFAEVLADVWREDTARRFTIFIFVSMLAFSAQDLILEPFAGAVFGLTPGQTTSLSGIQHGGVLVGMLLVAAAAGPWARGRLGTMGAWAVGGCVASALAIGGLAAASLAGPGWPLAANVFVLGAANGAFSIAAIGSMMQFAGQGAQRREGIRMGLWGAAQALAFAVGGIVGTASSDLAQAWLSSRADAYALVFVLEGALFLLSARLAAGLGMGRPAAAPWVDAGTSMTADARVATEAR